jgi:xylan 1,4-beta-xylosidase
VATRQPRELDILAWNYHDDDVAADPATIRLQIEGLPEQKNTCRGVPYGF